MSKASVINTQNKRECRYCHERDHIKGYFDKRQQCYVTTCPKLIAKKKCENNQDSFRRQALLKSHLNRKKKMEAGEFVEQRKNKFSYNRVKSTGPLLKKNQNKFAFFNEPEEELPQPILQGYWKKNYIRTKAFAHLVYTGVNITKPSSPLDDALLNRKRQNQLKKSKRKSKLHDLVKDGKMLFGKDIKCRPKIKESWADMCDSEEDEN